MLRFLVFRLGQAGLGRARWGYVVQKSPKRVKPLPTRFRAIYVFGRVFNFRRDGLISGLRNRFPFSRFLVFQRRESPFVL